jgi:ribosomal protein L7Ae-like RNA K-turn-binding protein
LNGLGLAARAGHVRIGADAVVRSVRKRQARAVVIAGDAPPSVRRRLERLLSSSGVPHTVVLDGDRLGRAVGRSRVVAVAVTDRSLGRRVLELAGAVQE